jgi:hypothetical protein
VKLKFFLFFTLVLVLDLGKAEENEPQPIFPLKIHEAQSEAVQDFAVEYSIAVLGAKGSDNLTGFGNLINKATRLRLSL